MIKGPFGCNRHILVRFNLLDWCMRMMVIAGLVVLLLACSTVQEPPCFAAEERFGLCYLHNYGL